MTNPIPANSGLSRSVLGAAYRLLVVVYTWRGQDIRIISARPAEPHEHEEYEAER